MKNRLLIVVLLAALVLGGLSFPRTADAGGGFCHTVRPGQTLSQIAAMYGVTVQSLVAANNLYNPNLIFVGQCLVIPSYAPPPPPPAPPKGCTVTHVVRPGEYLKQIAAHYGVSWQAIAAANGLSNPNLIFPGQRLVIPVKCQPPKPKPSPTPPPGKGPWLNQYWNNRYLSGSPTYTTYSNTIYYNWGTAGPGDGIPGQNFSARFTRSRYLDAGLYRFRIQVDDGARFWLDGVLLIDQWNQNGTVREFSVQKQVSTGDHMFQIDYFQAVNSAAVRFFVEPISPSPATFATEFFNNITLSGAPAATRTDSAINFNWGYNAPAAGVTADYFSARWTGKIAFEGGKYRFMATTDDGMRIWLDDKLILDEWRLTPTTSYQVDVDVSAGEHTLKVEFFENTLTAVAKVSWAKQ